jgi:WD40 repeat protein
LTVKVSGTVWDSATGQALAIMGGYGGRVSSVAFLRDRKTLATASHDGRVRLWDVALLLAREASR